MTAMAHYGMYVNDTDGISNIELEAESDVSYTSLGGPPLMNNYIKAKGGAYYAPLDRWILNGRAIPVNKPARRQPLLRAGDLPWPHPFPLQRTAAHRARPQHSPPRPRRPRLHRRDEIHPQLTSPAR